MAEPKTVSNLPLDVSIRWAEDQKILQETQPIIRDSGTVPAHAQTEVILPVRQSEVDILLDLSKLHPSWALFPMPPGFFLQRRRIFKSQIVPFLGTDEQQDAMMTRIQNAKGDHSDEPSWEDERARLLKLLQLLQVLNKDLIDISSRCKQYQKG